MQVYQIHETLGGGYDDNDYIIGTYMNEKLAQKEMDKLIEAEREAYNKATKCRNCPIWDEHISEKVIKKYCNNYKPYCDKLDECENYCYWNDKTYEIKEETVICESET